MDQTLGAAEKIALIVDDSKAIRSILGRTLGELGWSVREASNGRDALELLGRHSGPLSLVLVDWNMPEMNGLDFIRRIRSVDEGYPG
jgi:two-component system chemotaxis response regulator CheY